MQPRRLRAPSTDGALLAEPPLQNANELLAANAERLGRWDHDFQGRRVSRLRPLVRAQTLGQARNYLRTAGLVPPEPPSVCNESRLIVTGHQPELFHPGVWVKNFATAAIARRAGALGLNLIVDNDLPKSSSVRVPRRDKETIRLERVPFDEWRGEVPFEDLKVANEELFGSFGRRVRAALGNSVNDPLVDEFWPHVAGLTGPPSTLGTRFSLGRRALEDAWGIHNLEVPLSHVCQTEGFLWFACHILAHLPRFLQIHNDALSQYRALHGVRSRHHPVPSLAREADWFEAPFWVWRGDQPRRRPLLARQLASRMELRIGGEDTILDEIPLGPDREACCAVEQLLGLPARGVRLRPRALTTTMFSRLLLGDLFLHGIGGAKYDELGDEISGQFFGFEPPPYLTVSMTLWVGLGDAPGAFSQLAAAERELRDLKFNPDRHLDSSCLPMAAPWVVAKTQALSGPVDTAAQRRERFLAIRRCNEVLQSFVNERKEALLIEREGLSTQVRRNSLARNREYAAILHSKQHLRAALEHVCPGLLHPAG
ncbi:MAG: hypothetical protein NVSMB9_01170 [Isosphaeraceae bacterium]